MAVSLPRQNYDLMNRESNGRTAFEYDAIVTSAKSDTLKRSLDKDELSNEALGMSGKDKNESDNEPDGEPAAKMRRGGGRRKQSKPMRMFAELDTVVGEIDQMRPASDNLTVAESDYGKSGGTSAVSPDGAVVPSTSTFVCELCHENFQTGGALKEHFDQVHTVVLGEVPVRDNSCPTKYHLLGKELIQDADDFESSDKLGTKEMDCTVPEKQDLRLGTPISSDDNSGARCDWASVGKDEEGLVGPAGESVKLSERSHHTAAKAQPSDQPQVQFFFCGDEVKPPTSISFASSVMDKPHHEGNFGRQDFGASAFETGVQSESHSQAAASTSWDATKSRIFHPDAYCEICDREFCNKYFLKTHKANKHGIYDNNLSGFEVTSTSSHNELFFSMLQTQQPPSTTPPKSSPPKQPGDLGGSGCGSMANLPLLSGVSNMAEDSGSATPGKSSSSDSDECCDICQKHFVTKSQLKRHRQEAHGFPQSSDGSKRSNFPTHVSSPSSMLMNASMENPVSSHPLLLPHLTSATNSVPAALSGFNRMANLSNLMFLNPFNSPLAVIPPLFPTPGLGFRPNSLALPQLPLQDIQKAGSASRFPNDSSALPNSLLQSMGVLNAETLMELYRKEFCNNYMMRSQEASGRGGLFSNSMAGFPSGLSNSSLTGNITFPIPGKSGSQDSVMNNEMVLHMKKEKHDLSADSIGEMCEICKKTFTNKSQLFSHLATTHNIKQESCDLASELMKLDKLNEEHHFEKAMFGNMVAAKLVDRVQCDICNKEVCNKYFLKTHKIKVHGWDPVSGERGDMPQEKPAAKQASPMQIQNVVAEPPMADILNVEKPKEEELLQMGIDPEAYCEICKKEFCNKYFLKTHKQNIHGIKSTTNPLDNRTNPVEAWNYLPVSSQPNSLTAAQFSLLASSQQMQSFAPTLNAPPPLMSVLDSGLHDGSSSEKRSWKWKEPVNAMRVTCEICNKVLCNKYFLKTHMMKRHGVNYDTITGQLTSATGKPHIPSEYAALHPRDDAHPQDNFSTSSSHLAGPSQAAIEKQFANNRTVMRHAGIGDENQSMGEGGYGNEDDSSSAGGRITDRHDSSTRSSVNEGDSRVATAVNLVVSEALDLTSAATTVMAKTWHVPSDDQDIDNSRMNNDSLSCDATPQMTTSGFGGALPRGGADGGDLLPGETESLKIHSMKDMSLDEVHGSSEASSPLSSSFEESRNHHQSTVQSSLAHGKFEGVPVETAKTAIANHIRSQQQKKRLFRCTHCRLRFQMRSECEAHIRSAHPRVEGSTIPDHHVDAGLERTSRMQSSSSTNDPSSLSTNPIGYLNGYASAKQPNFSGESVDRKDSAIGSDVLSKQPVIYAQPIDQTNLSNILMQPFLLKEVGGDNHFAASLVYLPALQKINEPVSVTFSLTPILQH